MEMPNNYERVQAHNYYYELWPSTSTEAFLSYRNLRANRYAENIHKVYQILYLYLMTKDRHMQAYLTIH